MHQRILIYVLLLAAGMSFGQLTLRNPGFVASLDKANVAAGSSTLLTGLTAYWKLEEASGSRSDAVGSETLSDINTVTGNSGKVGNCGQFTSANNEYLSRSDDATMSTGNIDFTFCAWVYFDSLGNMTALAKLGGTDDEYGMELKVGVIQFYVRTDAAYAIATDATIISANTWYFLVGWHDAAADTVNVQVNNGTITSTSTSGSPAKDSNSDFSIGSFYGVTGFNGRVDEVGFWKRTLTVAERTELYNSGSGKTYPFP